MRCRREVAARDVVWCVTSGTVFAVYWGDVRALALLHFPLAADVVEMQRSHHRVLSEVGTCLIASVWIGCE
jgi:hypothetical protein